MAKPQIYIKPSMYLCIYVEFSLYPNYLKHFELYAPNQRHRRFIHLTKVENRRQL